jgi:replicative DNA helicase
MAPVMERVVPHDLDVERALLGATMIDADAAAPVVRRLPPDVFFRAAHAHVWRAAATLVEHGTPVDLVTLMAELKRIGLLEEVGGPAYLASLTDGLPRGQNLPHYAEIVQEHAVRRAVIAATQTLGDVAYAAETPATDLVTQGLAQFGTLATQLPRGGFRHVRTLLADMTDRMDRPGRRGWMTGFQMLDRMLVGLHRGDLILVAARPSIGKTAFLLNIASHAAVDEHAVVGLFSLEMTDAQLVDRLLCARGSVECQRLRIGRLNADEYARLVAARCDFDPAPLHIDDTPGLTIQELSARARLLQAEYGLEWVGVDYLQLMTTKERTENRQQAVSAISRGLKLLARDLSVPVVACSQLNRAPETRKDSRPQLSDLRETGALEQDADVVLMLWRDDANDEDRSAEVIVRKQRNGPIGTVNFTFYQEYTRFEEASTGEP